MSTDSHADSQDSGKTFRASIRSHIQIARPGHWIKNVFVLPGILVAVSIDRSTLTPLLLLHIIIGLLSVCLVTSSNYVINEILDASSDREHPTKRNRAVPSGRINISLAYVQWIALGIAGIGISLMISIPMAITMACFWIQGCIYNIRPFRSKDIPYLDVLSESVNNPLRMLAGWFITRTSLIPPASLLVSYWMIGAYFMTVKRLAEYRDINDHARSIAYRKSFAFYDQPRLLVSIMFYSSSAMLFLGAFIMRYRMEWILCFPLVALVMAMYLSLAFKENSAVQRPEGLYREPLLMTAIIACTALMLLLLFVDLPVLHRIFIPSIP